MSNVRKKISELTPLTSASLDTVVVGVDNGTTYKIELDVLADAVTSRVNILDRNRLSSLESATSSFETKGRSILSGSVSYTSLTNIPQGIVSQSADLSLLNSFTSSYFTDSASFSNRILAATNEQSFNGLISGSSQLTSSYDERYVISGSITQTTWDNIANKPNDIISSSTQISDFGFISGSYETTGRSILSGSVSYTDLTNIPTGLVSQSTDIADFQFTSQTITNDEVTIVAADGDIILDADGGVYIGSSNPGNGIVTDQYFDAVVGDITRINNGTGHSITDNLDNIINSIPSISSLNTFTESIDSRVDNLENSTGSYITSLPIGIISGSDQLTSSLDLIYTLSGSVQPLPDGLISGSSQLTSSYDTRYTLSGSVVSGTTPAGTISGSSQLTSSFDGRYVQTGSFNSLTQSFNSFTASAQSITTGSNSFNGTQTITGSLIITTGSFIGSQITANTSSLYLTSGSNIYVQNDGLVEITGSLKVKGTTRFETVGGDEGGEIEFGVPQTNTTLSTRVVADIFQNRLRIFDGNTNGVYIDISKAPTGVAGEITYKASGIVNAGTFVTLDNLKATVSTSGNRSLEIATISGSFSSYIIGSYVAFSGGTSGVGATPSVTTTPALAINWNFTGAGDTATYIINDTTNGKVYRIIMMIGGGYNSNFISIERLH